MCWKLFTSLVAMCFLWVGSQIPLFLYGSAIAEIYSDIGGADGMFLWMIIGFLIPNSALCPFVGALSDLFGRRYVAAVGQVALIVGPAIVSNSHSMHMAIAGMVISGFGAGLNELISLAGTSEIVPARQRGFYVALVIFSIAPFIPSPMWAQLIQRAGNWRYIGFLVGGWNLVGLILVLFFYHGPSSAKTRTGRTAKDILREVDYVGGILSTVGCTVFMMGIQWGVNQVSRS
jgi:MFS family permease